MPRHNPTKIVLQAAVFLSILASVNLSREAAAQNGGAAATKLTKCSEIRIEAPLSEALAADSQLVFIGSVDGSIQAFDAAVSARVWRSELGGEIVSNIIPHETGVAVVSNSVQVGSSAPADSVIRLLGKQTGVPNWTARLPFSERYYLGNVTGAFVAVSREGAVISLDTQNGRVNWRTQPLGKISARPSFSQNGIGLGTADKQIYAVSPATGDVLFKGPADFIPTAIAGPTAETIVAGDERGTVASIRIRDGKSVWKFKSGAAVSFASVNKEGLFITSLDNFLYLISMYNGDVIWKRRLPGRALEGGLILDGFVLVLIYGENSAFLIETKKGKVVDQLPNNDNNLVSQIPVVVRDGKVAISAADSVSTYSLNGCEYK